MLREETLTCRRFIKFPPQITSLRGHADSHLHAQLLHFIIIIMCAKRLVKINFMLLALSPYKSQHTVEEVQPHHKVVVTTERHDVMRYEEGQVAATAVAA